MIQVSCLRWEFEQGQTLGLFRENVYRNHLEVMFKMNVPRPHPGVPLEVQGKARKSTASIGLGDWLQEDPRPLAA